MNVGGHDDLITQQRARGAHGNRNIFHAAELSDAQGILRYFVNRLIAGNGCYGQNLDIGITGC